MKLDLRHLNKEQKQAVVFGNGPLLLIAGAGTGKTRVITQRIAYLIKQGKANPEEILATTFTEKAAEEMEDRVDRLLAYGYTNLWITTFHSFCKRVLEENGLDIGLNPDFKLIDETGAWLLMRRNLDKFELEYYKPLSNPTKFIKALFKHFSRCKDQAISPNDYLKYSKRVKDKNENIERIKEIARAYSTYQELVLENNLLDFGDLIDYCLKLFQKRPLILKKYRDKFKYILVDEFQDTNWAQYQLIKILSAPKNNLLVSADDDQAIYRWRGASFANIIQFNKDFPRAKKIVLKKNYRSTQNILNLSYKFIQLNNPNRLEYIQKINKKLVASKQGNGIIEHMRFNTMEQEANGIVNKIINLMNTKQANSWNEFAVLSRSNESANRFSKTLERAQLPYQFLALRGLYSKPVILDIISYLKLLDDYHEASAVYRVLNLPFYNIGYEDIGNITRYSKEKTQSIYESLKKSNSILGLSETTIRKINEILGLIKKHSFLSKQKSASQVFVISIQDLGYLKYLTKNQKDLEIQYLNQFYEKIKSFEESHIDISLRAFMEELDLELESGNAGKLNFDINEGPDMIKVMTIHSAKGLEFEYVFLTNLVDRRFPTIEKTSAIQIPNALVKESVVQGDAHLQEERRLFYVGMTRAKKGLFFTSADDYGGKRKKKISMFLKELGYTNEKYEITSKNKIKLNKVKKIKKKKNKIILPKHFSFSQFIAFDKCPLQYKFTHILKIPIQGNAHFSFGKTIHNTLFGFVKDQELKKLELKDLLEIYNREWIDEWYDNKNQKQKYYKLGKKILRNFYKSFIKDKPSILFINNLPALEQNFTLKINNNTLIGKIDRIDKLENGVEVIDYKTGKPKEKISLKDKEQLLIYQIACEKVLNLKPLKLTYYYLETGTKLSFLGSEQDKQKEIEKILLRINKMKKSNFEATPSWDCHFCNFRNICEYAKK